MHTKPLRMEPGRIDTLADGLFAIVMTILILEVHVPRLSGDISNKALWDVLQTYGPIVMSYVLSFAVLFTYWRAHHYIMGVYAKTLDTTLMNINALFFLFVAFVPFSSGLLGMYHETELAIAVYGINVIFIGLTIWWMRHHVIFTDYVESVTLSPVDVRHGTMRTIIPVVFAAIAIPVSFWNTNVSLTLFTLAVIFNLLRGSTRIVDRLMGFKGV